MDRGVAHQLAWDDFKLVRAIAQARSLAGAAGLLGINASTVFRRLGETEARLGLRLFERYRQGYVLTAAGEEMSQLAERFDEESSAFFLKHVGQNAAPSGEVRVTTTHSLTTHLLTPILADFRRHFRDIRLDLVLSNVALNLSRRDADVAIRVTETPPENLIGRRIATMAVAMYGARSLLGECDKAADEALQSAPLVALGNDHVLQRAARYFRAPLAAERIVYTIDNVLGLAKAVEAGIGIGALPCLIGDQTADLVRLSPPEREVAPSIWLLTHPELRHSPRVRAFLDFVGDALMKKRALIEGLAAERQPAPAPARRAAKVRG
jgi:DNA-binding transcriptional LysR family regulator